MFMWMNSFQKSLVHQDSDMFVDEWTSVNEIPGHDQNQWNQSVVVKHRFHYK